MTTHSSASGSATWAPPSLAALLVSRCGVLGWLQAQYESMTEDHGALLESLEAAEAARGDLEQTISSLKIQAARDRRERRCVAAALNLSHALPVVHLCALLQQWPRLKRTHRRIPPMVHRGGRTAASPASLYGHLIGVRLFMFLRRETHMTGLY